MGASSGPRGRGGSAGHPSPAPPEGVLTHRPGVRPVRPTLPVPPCDEEHVVNGISPYSFDLLAW